MFGVQYLAVFVLFCFCIFRVDNVGIIDQKETCRVYCKIENIDNIPCKVKFLGKHCNLTSEDYGVRRKHIPKKLYNTGYNCSEVNDKVVFNIGWRQRGYKRYPLIDGYLFNMEYVTVTKRESEYYLIESNVTNVSKHYTFTLSWECNRSIVFVRTKMIVLPNKKRLIKKVIKEKKFPDKLETDKIEIYVPKRCKKKEPCHCLTSFKLHSNSTVIGVMYKPSDPSIGSRVEVNSFDGQIFLMKRCIINNGNCSLIFSELNPANYTVSVFYRSNESEDGCKCYVLRQKIEVTDPRSVLGEFHMSESKQKTVKVMDLDTVLIISAAIGCFITVSIMIIISMALRRKKMLDCRKPPKIMSDDFDTFDMEPPIHSGPTRVMLISCYEETNIYIADAVKRFADLLGECSIQVTHFYNTASHGQLMANVNDFVEQSVSSSSVFLFVLTNKMSEKLIHRKRKYTMVSKELLDVGSSYDVVSYTIDLIRRKRHKRCHWIQFSEDEDNKRHLFVTESLRKLYPMFQDSKQWCMVNKHGGFNGKVWKDFIENICNSTSGSGFISQERIDNFVTSVKKYINYQNV